MSYYFCCKCHERTEIFSAGGGERAAKEWQTTFLGGIPLVTEVRVGGDRGVPIVVSDPRSEISGIFRSIARNLSNVIREAHLQVSKEGEPPRIFKV
ncbi:MAG: P-loop NTPase [Deltaproteobacteria bacterium]